MKLATYSVNDRERVGVVLEGGILDAGAALAATGADIGAAEAGDMTAFLRWRPDATRALAAAVKAAVASGVAVQPLHAVRLRAPVLRPGKILGVGLNYAAHAAEAGGPRQARPRMFFKAATALIGPGEAIRKPDFVTKLDFEGELAAVIGREGRNIDEAEAMAFVGGLTICNDVSAREFQFDVVPAQTSFAKSMDSFCPLGPWLVTPDELPASLDLRLQTRVNGTLMQDARTSTMIFSLPTIIAYLSRHMTLAPGDIISTGTPEGSGHFRKPPVYLGPGDRIRIEIEGIGGLENQVA